MDIDTRRSMGMYCKLGIPVEVRERLDEVCLRRTKRIVVLRRETGDYMVVDARRCVLVLYDKEYDWFDEVDLVTGEWVSSY
jgi:hypothetical protein